MLLIEILRLRGRCEVGHQEADNLRHGHNDAFRQVATKRHRKQVQEATKEAQEATNGDG